MCLRVFFDRSVNVSYLVYALMRRQFTVEAMVSWPVGDPLSVAPMVTFDFYSGSKAVLLE